MNDLGDDKGTRLRSRETKGSKMIAIDLLKGINVLCRDNGKVFTDTQRLEVISENLRGSGYASVSGNLFRLYSKKPIEDFEGKLLLISSHVDCERSITECFSREETDEILKGTYDNSITNAAILALMMEGKLPEQVVVAFTGDEEEDSRGAAEVTNYLRKKNKKFRAVTLDVTDVGWNEDVDFTIENNFWGKKMGKLVCNIANDSGYPWLFVPEDPDDVPDYIPPDRIYPEEAEADESWEYDEHDVKCFSLCLPCKRSNAFQRGGGSKKAKFYSLYGNAQ